ncbi:TIGR03086 family metal-binding protein [Nonomuraea sp. NPDC050328]|uniref:TIGR03086 family metal-binding protein n=1 Tax=Nonomuraea sp. NPDC050328 TaxID=3364361 RepID=UPI0037917AE6
MSENNTPWTVLTAAHEALRTAVQGVPADAWDRPTPCDQWTVTQVLQHAAGDQLGFAAFITGGPGPEENPFAPSGRIDGSPADLAENSMRASAAAWATIAPDAAEVPVPVPPNKLPAEVGAAACALDAAVHAWDIAVATGQPSPLTSELARGLQPALAIVEPLRAYGAYATALEEQPGDDDAAKLLRFLGRRPDWTA